MPKNTMTNDDYRQAAAKMFLITAALTVVITAVRPRALPPLAIGLASGYTVGAASGIGFGPELLQKADR